MLRAGYPRSVRRVLRAAGRTHRQFPDSLRDRLLAIPGTTQRFGTQPIRDLAADDSRLTWILASPFAPIAASFLVAAAVSVFFGNPYQAGAATVTEMRGEMAPTAMRVRASATRLAGAASDVGEAAIGVLPRVGLSASRAIARTLQEHVDRGDVVSTRPSAQTPSLTDSQPRGSR